MPRRPEDPLFAREKLRAALVRLRERARITPAEAARRAGVSQGEWSEWEKGNRGIELGNLGRALRGVGATLHNLADELEPGLRGGAGFVAEPAGSYVTDAGVLGVIADLAARNRELTQRLALFGEQPDVSPVVDPQHAAEVERRALEMLDFVKGKTRPIEDAGGGEG